ncbi:unnamed protein product [Protopolystoma xenopodis]|uniref:Uncharacterized protein n=1 Tax=Protopolystoma xenopodis TaxID=117903 RepID=A0A3S5A0U2_9PLAT|nr:unnamed protein product [Protopolystoma xenopodis]
MRCNSEMIETLNAVLTVNLGELKSIKDVMEVVEKERGYGGEVECGVDGQTAKSVKRGQWNKVGEDGGTGRDRAEER